MTDTSPKNNDQNEKNNETPDLNIKKLILAAVLGAGLLLIAKLFF